MRQRLATNLILVGASVLLMSLCFPPVDLSLSAGVCLVPWFLLILREPRRWVVGFSWLTGLVFFYVNVAWIRHVTYPAWVALAFYLSFFFLVFGAATRFICGNSCLPMTIAAPVGWVGQEYLRSFMVTGFPWLFLGHTQYKNLAAIQIADLTGVYGISFVLVTINACLADLVLLWIGWRRNAGRIVSLVVWTLLLVVATLAYGGYRLAQYAPRVGPRVCVVQGNTPQSVKMKTDLKSCRDMLAEYEAVSLEAKGQEMDLVVWPETMVPGYFNLAEYLDRLNEGDFKTLAEESLAAMRRLSAQLGAALVVGGQSYTIEDKMFASYNSAFYFDKDYFERYGKFRGRYDKIHLVPFGEFVPLQRTLPFLNSLLTRLAGYVPDFSAGRGATIFQAGEYKFGVLICYEDTIGPLVRQFRYRDGEKGADFLLNLSNDGWFSGSSELDQHLAICVFRAVENRVGIARAVNTGISGFIAPNGRIEGVVAVNGRRKLVRGALVRAVAIEDRLTFYTFYGEVFARVCLLGWLGMIGYSVVSHRRRRETAAGGEKSAFFA